jgi:hypothetical protein
MSNRNATFAKRQREQTQKEKARLREQRRVERLATKKAAGPDAPAEDGVDPDIAGIIPGPQPRAEEDLP